MQWRVAQRPHLDSEGAATPAAEGHWEHNVHFPTMATVKQQEA